MLMLTALLAGCAKSPYKDGVYRKEAPEFTHGWKETVEITIAGGKIAKVSWDAIAESDDIPVGKKQYSMSGLYGMLAADASDEWCDQAKLAEDFILRNGIEPITLKEDGYTDAISGCTISVDVLKDLAAQCLEEAGR